MDHNRPQHPSHDNACAGARVLIVEDEDVLAEMSRRVLTRWGYQVVGVFKSGEAALSSVSESSPDLVLMDISLAGQLDGYETARRLVASHPVPVFFMTGFNSEEVDDLMADLGVPWQAAPKPIPFAQMREGIEALLHIKERQQSTT